MALPRRVRNQLRGFRPHGLARRGILAAAAFIDAECLRLDQAREGEADTLIQRTLSATTLNPDDVRACLRRDLYPIVASALTRICGVEVSEFADNPPRAVLLYRLAGATRLIRRRSGYTSAVTIDDVRAASRDRQKRDRARLVLAGIGDESLDWVAADRRERAVFLLAILVAACREARR